jgi:signal transduction histidine kinase
VTILRPAVAYLTAAERAMVAAQDTSAEGASELASASLNVQIAAQQLTKARATAELTADELYQLDALLDLSRAIRNASTDSLSADTWIAQLRQLQSGVTQLITTIVNAQLNPDPRLELLAQTLGARFSLSMQQALATTAGPGATDSPELFEEIGVEAAAIDRLASALGDSEPAIAALRTDNAQRSRTVRIGDDDFTGRTAYGDYDALTEKLLAGIDDRLADSASAARRSALISGGITAGALLATLLLAYLVSRLLLGPIRRVREGAHTVAQEQLPAAVARIRSGSDPGPITPIDVDTHEEIGQLARAVDDLHRQAVSLAAGEARLRSQVSEMFITLSRRNTSLVNQQLRLIEALEKDEEDPRRLDSLFRLDHLAARMRRTAESLLVLASAPTPAATEDNVTVAAALQAATAGVQDYQRVRLGTASAARISKAAAGDIVHLLTELVDNALAYSPPTTTVLLNSTAAADGVRIAIEDAGLGVPDQTLAGLNKTLRSGGDVTPETARRMGLFVVSRLAKRHGIVVTLQRNQGHGMTATVLLPTAILDVADEARPTAPAQLTPPPVAPPRPFETPAKAPAPSLADRLDAATALPRRQPGAQTPQTEPAALAELPAAPAELPAAPADMPAAPVDLPAAPVDVPAAPVEVPAASAEAPNAPAGAPAALAASVPTLPASNGSIEAPPEIPALEPFEPVQMSAADHLTGPAPATFEDSGEETDTPIFKSLRSAWLSADDIGRTWRSTEIEEGWERADRVAESLADAPLNDAGLPMRRPGTRLVPGGVAKPVTVHARDPEAVRARLAAHAAGVSRGRSAAAAAAPGSETSEESHP